MTKNLSLMDEICLSVDILLAGFNSTLLHNQDQAQGFPSQWVGRGCIRSHLSIWAGPVRPKTAKNKFINFT